MSYQIIREFVATVTIQHAIAQQPYPSHIIEYESAAFQRICSVVTPDAKQIQDRLTQLLLQHQVSGKAVHDANMVATMQAHGVQELLTHNRKDIQRFAPAISLRPLDGGA